MEKFDVVIVGAGAAGCFTAIQIKERFPNARIIILEKSNKVLAKVKISGGGRCNVTNVLHEPRELASSYPRGEKLLRKLFYEFSSRDMIHWLAQNKVPLRLYEDGCYFPESNDSQTIIDLFLTKLEHGNVDIRLQEKISRVWRDENQWKIESNDRIFETKNVVFAIGGQPKIDGFSFLSNLELNLVEPVPSLFTFNLPKHPITQLMGIVQEVVIVKLQGQKWTTQGPLLITHWGMSGPAILKASAYGARFLAEKAYQAEFMVNWTGIDNHNQVRQELERLNKSGKLVLNERFPGIKSRLWEYLIDRSGIAADRKWIEVGSKQLNKLHEVLVNDLYKMHGKTTFKEEFVTAGGISLDELNPKSMESKKHPGLYFAGEMVDIDGITGGFNFQGAWTAAFIIAKNIQV